jgi:hypothetical protein
MKAKLFGKELAELTAEGPSATPAAEGRPHEAAGFRADRKYTLKLATRVEDGRSVDYETCIFRFEQQTDYGLWMTNGGRRVFFPWFSILYVREEPAE